jgi:hypothetical protein
MKKLALFGALIFALAGCAGMGGESAAMKGDADADAATAAIAAAEAALKKARGVEGEWRDANKSMLKKAKAAASKGDYKTAIKLADQAKFQGDMGYEQAMGQKDVKPWLF